MMVVVEEEPKKFSSTEKLTHVVLPFTSHSIKPPLQMASNASVLCRSSVNLFRSFDSSITSRNAYIPPALLITHVDVGSYYLYHFQNDDFGHGIYSNFFLKKHQ